jgi:hypothetical protein
MPATRHDRVAGLTLLAEYIGDDAARKLCMAWGGCPVKVPKGRAGLWWQRLVQTLGERDAGEFCEAFGGETLYIPRNAADEREAIRQRVATMLADGMSYLQIARTLTFQVRYTERGLRKLMERRVKPDRRAEDPRQMSLLPEPDVLHAAWAVRGHQVEESAADCAATLGS